MENGSNTHYDTDCASLTEAARPAQSVEDILDKNGSFVWLTRGASMRPLLKTGRDVIEIKKPEAVYPDGILKVNDVALYKVPFKGREGQYILHRVRQVHDGFYIICGDNNVIMEKVPVSWVIGVMTGLTRRGRNVDLNGFFYKSYVKHWGGRYRRRMILKRIGFAVKKPLRPVYHRIRSAFKRR